MKVILLTLGIVGLVGCATTPRGWEVSENAKGGIVAYNDGGNLIAKDLAKNHCGGRSFYIVSNDLKTRETSSTVYMPVSSTATTDGSVYGANRLPMSYDQTTQVNSMVPVQERGLDSWREVTYECR
jgi:hypothetical protein